MPDRDLTTEAGLDAAMTRVRALRAQADPIGPDDVRWLLDVAAAALRQIRPAPQPPAPDARPAPPWLIPQED
jgi:hypothetical protein